MCEKYFGDAADNVDNQDDYGYDGDYADGEDASGPPPYAVSVCSIIALAH